MRNERIRKTLFSALILTGVLLSSGLAVAQSPSPLQIYNGQDLSPGVTVIVGTARGEYNWVSNDGASLRMAYPGGMLTTSNGTVQENSGFVVFQANSGFDASAFTALKLTMRSDTSSVIRIAIADAAQASLPQDKRGVETRVLITLTDQWQTYYLPLSWFLGSDTHTLKLLAEILFQGSNPQNAWVSEVGYTTQPPAPNYALPDFTFGGGSTTTLYLTNRSGAIVQVPLAFFNSDGTGMDIPAPSNGSLTTALTVTLGPQQTSALNFPKTGPVSAGYVLAQLSPDVSAWADLRTAVTGQSDQKTNMTFAPVASRSGTIIFDETNSVTTFFVVNPSSLQVGLTLTATGTAGSQIGKSTLTLAPGARQAFTLRSVPELAGVSGNAGALSFTTTTTPGDLAVAAIATEGSVVTAIPVSAQ